MRKANLLTDMNVVYGYLHQPTEEIHYVGKAKILALRHGTHLNYPFKKRKNGHAADSTFDTVLATNLKDYSLVVLDDNIEHEFPWIYVYNTPYNYTTSRPIVLTKGGVEYYMRHLSDARAFLNFDNGSTLRRRIDSGFALGYNARYMTIEEAKKITIERRWNLCQD